MADINDWWRAQKTEAAKEGYSTGHSGIYDASANPYLPADCDPTDEELGQIWHAWYVRGFNQLRTEKRERER